MRFDGSYTPCTGRDADAIATRNSTNRTAPRRINPNVADIADFILPVIHVGVEKSGRLVSGGV